MPLYYLILLRRNRAKIAPNTASMSHQEHVGGSSGRRSLALGHAALKKMQEKGSSVAEKALEHTEYRLALQIRAADKSIDHIRFLFEAYRPSAWYFELCECIRRLLLSCMLIFFAPGTATQIVIAMMITAVFLVIYIDATPFLEKSDHNVAYFAQWNTLLTLFASLLLFCKVDESDGYDSDTFGLLLVLINVGVVW